MTTVPQTPFHDGRSIPQLGYGVWQVEDEVAADVVEQAIRAGYRHIDTAAIYGNEKGVGRAVAASGVPREELFITTKVWNSDHGYEEALAALDTSLAKLGTDYVDLWLIHWAKPTQGRYLETWKALIEAQRRGRVRSIGVSNFPAEQLEEIIEATGVVPVIHQVETHPYFQQRALRELEQRHGILHESWSPLGQGGELLADPVITRIAEAKGTTPAQVVLAWHLAHGFVVIPKSVTPERIVSNLEAVGLVLSDEEVARIDALDREDGRIGPDPAHIEF
ncbi:aldo/keto reductase [Micrococcus sp.]|uniref:aldo/keto reductase n=1 Tax=Micrococcus sp. TaxID=1271 RepID=UPI002A91335B|nr:aldo/keto reductase [Micrococcus sp.]MDY6054701.1 aldo/keto reductase [Micrococcus sp.]